MNVLAISKHGKALSDISKSTRPANVQLDEKKSFISRLLLLWVGNLLYRGSEKTLVYDDLTPLKQKHRSVNLLRKWKKHDKNNNSHIAWKLLWHFKYGVMCAFSTRVFSMIFDYLNPVLLKILLDSVTMNSAPIMKGVIISILMLLVGEIKSFVLAAHTYIAARDANLSVAILTNSIAKKSLKLSSRARQEWPSSRVVNLISVDLESLSVAAPFFHASWSSVVEISIAMLFIFHILGSAFFGAVIVMIAYIPVNVVVNIVSKRLQSAQMKVRDKRIKFVKEILSGIKVVKLYAWEEPFNAEIDRLRREEMKYLSRHTILGRALQGLNSAAPFVVAIVSLTWFVWTNGTNSLTPQVAFVSLTIFNMLRLPMAMLAPSFHNITKAMVSMKRINNFLKSKELQTERPSPSSNEAPEVGIHLHHATFSWDLKPTALSDICLEVEEKKFHAIIGPVGAGKSSLLSAILGELTLLSGHKKVNGNVAFVPQVPWILNTTIRSNILYGQDYEKPKYEKIVRACDMKKDFYNMPRYDCTVIGENKIPLSGGQIARIALARALYQNCDIYLLDDPFAAVDRQVTKTMFDKVLGPNGILAKKTVILVTHNMNLAKSADVVHLMNDGRIIDSGSFEDVARNNSSLVESSQETQEDDLDDLYVRPKKKPRAVMFEPENQEQRKVESTEQGRVKSHVYLSYIRAFSYKYAGVFTVLLCCRYALQALSGVFLSHLTNNTDVLHSLDFSYYIYLGIGTVILSVISMMSSTFGGIRASIVLHRPLVASLLHAPLYFFEKTPIGGILNRFTVDMDAVDFSLPITLRLVVDAILNIIMVMIVISASIPAFIVFVVPFAIGYLLILKRFLPTSRQVKRIECSQRSSLLSTLTQNIQGASSIRAFGRTKMTNLQFKDEVDSFLRCRYLQPSIQQWLSLRLELLGNLMIFASAILATVFHQLGWVNAGAVGLCVSFALTLTQVMNFSVRMIGLTDNYMVSVERIKEYHHLPLEANRKSDYPLIDAWPHTGSIDFLGYNMYYDKDVHALKDITASIKGGEKIAIVGRTGSGKSSLAGALLRLVEADSGKISIDGVDISDLGLHELRSRLTIIPQEPILFSSTLRFNLDPFNQYADSDLWLAIDACSLKSLVSRNGGMQWLIEEGGANLSIGERQLICLSRALLRGGQILILDEATSSVDHQTDKMIYQIINDHFKHATVLFITHRLNALEHCHRVMVMDNGQIVEFDKPDVLLENDNSLFKEISKRSK
ncbi:unnamed protein product [Auanema sp. JU1783]|nr:unnamed protein product [Auanema sp. JU1783]